MDGPRSQDGPSDDTSSTGWDAETAPPPQVDKPPAHPAKTEHRGRQAVLVAFAAGFAVPGLFISGFFTGAAWNGGSGGADAAPVPAPTAAPAPAPSPTGEPTPAGEPVPVPGFDESAAPPDTSGPGTPYVFGNPDAPTITIVEDYNCPYCAQFAQEQGPGIDQAVEEGKLQVKYYTVAYFGLASLKMAEAAGCAADQDAYQAYSTLLYEKRPADGQQDVDLAVLVDLAGDPGSGIADLDAFKACVESGEYRDYIESVTRSAQAASILATPTVFVNGE